MWTVLHYADGFEQLDNGRTYRSAESAEYYVAEVRDNPCGGCVNEFQILNPKGVVVKTIRGRVNND